MSVRVKEMEFPAWAPRGAAAVMVGVGVAILAQRHAFFPPSLSMLAVALAVVPWVFDCAVHVPEWLFTVMVLTGASLALVHPVALDISPFLFVMLTGRAGTLQSPRRALAVGAAAIAIPVAFDLTHSYSGSQVWAIGIGLAGVAGAAFQRQLLLLHELRSAQADLADRAAADERQRIAREIHDVVAHSLTVTMLHLSGARLALDSDPAEAAEALAEAEKLGRQSLADIRRTVGLLGRGAGVDRALPTASEISELVAGYARAGLDVRYSAEGDVGSVPLTVGLCLYRVTQESLANVAKHAPGSPAVVSLVVGDEDVRLRVQDGGGGRTAVPAASGSSVPAGMGVAGMRDRVVSLGGTFRAADVDGGWVVEAVLPRGAA